ncbi:MAG: exopolysaccharide biosynthesis polyprenyl glycosylphosphotransferase [Spirochaetales bacterium]|nr:exopolysaccharide biosynthesis polyprenyl glycosylphosphotransferase [Spirochaetales bacterium]
MDTGESKKLVYTLRFVVDSVMVLLAWFGSTLIRFRVIEKLDYREQLPDILFAVPILLFLNFYFFHSNNLYSINRYTQWTKEMYIVIKSAIQSFMGSILAFFFIRYHVFSRMSMLLFLILLIFFLTAGRVFLHNVLMRLRIKGFNKTTVLLIGRGKEMDAYLELIKNQPSLGIKPIAWYDPPLNRPEEIPVVEGNIKDFLKTHHVDNLVVCSGKDDTVPQSEYRNQIYNLLVPVIILSDRQFNFLNAYVDNLDNLTLFHQNKTAFDMTDRTIKRVMDVAGALAGFVVFAPVFLICPLIIKLTSRGPVIYKQTRMSRDGALFTMYKFRSMPINAEEETGAVWVTKDDDRATGFGKLMRSTSVDELPQLWNILKGEMSLVGPRPERPELIEGFKEKIPGYMLRHKVKGGLTGWAQVNGWRGDTSLYKRVEYDIRYINDWSIWLDLKIIFLTLFRGFIHENAY